MRCSQILYYEIHQWGHNEHGLLKWVKGIGAEYGLP